MTVRNHLFAVLTLIALVAFSTAYGQVATGTPGSDSFGGGPFDSVDLGNLNVHFAVPIIRKAGRGMPFSYTLAYDTSVWTPLSVNGQKTWQPAFNWGWSAQTAIKVGYLSFLKITTRCDWPPPKTGTYTIWSGFAYHDPWGGTHRYIGTLEQDLTGCDNGNTSSLNETATDGSGYTLSATYTTHTITTKGGQVLNPPVNLTSGYSSGSYSATDSNGNQVSVASTSSSVTFTDTLGQTALTVSGTSPVTFAYTAPSGAQAGYTMNYVQYTVRTNFAITGTNEYGPLSNALVDNIQLPDGSKYIFTYEKTPGSCTPLSGTYSAYCVTGRVASVALPTGGTITYEYSGGPSSTGVFSDGSTAVLTRILAASTTCTGPCWQYTRALGSGTPGPGSKWTTTVVDPSGNNTFINFSEDGNTSKPTYGLYETQRQVYQGSISSNNLLLTTTACFNNNYASCSTASVTSPITQTDRYAQPAGGSSRLSETLFNSSGLVTDDKEYDYGVTTGAAPGNTKLIRETATTYATLGNGILNRPATVKVYDWTSGSQVQLAASTFGYDQTSVTTTTGTPQHNPVTGSRGNLTTSTTSTSSTTSLSRTFTYYDTGNPKVATDVNGAQTTYVYGTTAQGNTTISCGNSFATTINEPLSLSRSIAWNCTGGVSNQVTDENSNAVSSDYSTDPDFWRPASVTDQLSNQTKVTYSVTTAETALQNFNGGSSSSDSLSTLDGFGRSIFSQRLQAPGSSNYDTVETDYNNLGQPYRYTMPYTATASPSSQNTTVASTTRTYDAMGRVLSITDGSGGTVSYTYTANDILQKVSGTPNGTQTFQKQFEYDGLGRLASVCEMTSTLPGYGTCGQSTSQYGYWTRYKYDALGHLLGVCQNTTEPLSVDCSLTHSSAQQTRAFTYDWAGRTLTESNPETGSNGANGTATYTYDTACATTPASPGDLTGKRDQAGNTTCFAYDALHRMTAGGYSTVCRRFHYDTSVTPPSGITVANTNTRLIEITTDNCSTTTYTAEWFSYDKRGEMTDVWESTPNSGGYYHSTAGYWPTGVLNTLSLLNSSGTALIPSITYKVDGEGRTNLVNAATRQNPVTSVSYSTGTSTAPLGALTGVTFGSADNDAFTYDPNTGRMATYTFKVNGQTDAGTLTWSANGTLSKLVINDQITGTADSQTCTYGYDDVQRISNVTCGTFWVQNFTYDPSVI